jgi:hypothetical protein
MSPTRTLDTLTAIGTDRAGLLGGLAALAAQLPTEAVYGYIMARLLIPVALIVLAGRGATPSQRIQLVSTYLTNTAVARRGREAVRGAGPHSNSGDRVAFTDRPGCRSGTAG